MSDQGAEAQPQGQQVQLRLDKIYLKDASFESPSSPGIFQGQWRPELKVDINTSTNSMPEDRFEVVLSVTVEAKVEDNVGFIVEVQQSGLFTILGAGPEVLQRVLGIACPNTLFPYVREALDALVVKGGFPALQIAPVNFEALYAQAMQKAAAEQGDVKH